MAQVMISYRVPETGAKELGGDGTVERLADALQSLGFSVFVGEQEGGLVAGWRRVGEGDSERGPVVPSYGGAVLGDVRCNAVDIPGDKSGRQ
jgi:hypothetical protein